MAYRIPVTNYPNQTFNVTIPVDGVNIEMEVTLNYNSVAKYWSMSARNIVTNEILFSQIPLLASYMRFANFLVQMTYKRIGSAFVYPQDMTHDARPDDSNIGKNYKLLWADSGL